MMKYVTNWTINRGWTAAADMAAVREDMRRIRAMDADGYRIADDLLMLAFGGGECGRYDITYHHRTRTADIEVYRFAGAMHTEFSMHISSRADVYDHYTGEACQAYIEAMICGHIRDDGYFAFSRAADTGAAIPETIRVYK
jgi:hypothetical protein